MALINVGALWIREGKSGKFMGGNIEIDEREYSIMIFKNNRKENEDQPDYRIVMPDDVDNGVHGKEPQRNYQREEEPDDDDIPF